MENDRIYMGSMLKTLPRVLSPALCRGGCQAQRPGLREALADAACSLGELWGRARERWRARGIPHRRQGRA